MYKHGFVKVEAATPKMIAGDITNNQKEIINILNNSQASLIVFPELTITGYSMSDLFFQSETIKDTYNALDNILKNNQHEGLAAIGMPLLVNDVLFNVGVVIQKDKILGVVPKYYLPNHLEYSEKRWFVEGTKANFNKVLLLGKEVPFGKIIFREPNKNIKVGIEVCQDMWTINPPSNDLALNGANIILNLSASSELVGKEEVRRNIVLHNSLKQVAAYVYTTTGFLESSSEFVFSSHKVISSLGKVIAESPSFEYKFNSLVADININEIEFKRKYDSNFRDSIFKSKDIYQTVDFNINENDNYYFETMNKLPFVPNEKEHQNVYEVLTAALVKKLLSLPKHLRKVIIGLSGGLDSTHALLIAHNAFLKLGLPLKDLIVVAMPSLVSSKDSVTDSIKLTKELNLELLNINIESSVEDHLKLIDHKEEDVTYENVQARIRTLILMDLANKYEGIVLGTGDLSEIALGFMTYSGDQMSMYAINSGLPKTLIRSLTTYYANNLYPNIKDVLIKIVNKKVSPELLKDQVTEDLIGDYEINDFIMYYHLVTDLNEDKLKWLISLTFNLSKEEANDYVNRFMNRFYNNQFKRTTLPEGPKVFSLGLSPRGSMRLPSDVNRK